MINEKKKILPTQTPPLPPKKKKDKQEVEDFFLDLVNLNSDHVFFNYYYT